VDVSSSAFPKKMETNNYEKRFKTLVSALHKNAECPVCLETVKPPFKLCVQGHSVCVECMKKIDKCPLCQGKFVLENPVCVKNILEALPHFCRYSDTGCEEVVESGNDHEMFCGYRPIVCRSEGCSIKMPVVKIIDHYKSNHPEDVLVTKHEDKICTKALNNRKIEYIPVTLFNNLFWVVEVIDDTKNHFKILFEATPIGKLTQDYYVCVELKKDKMVYAFTLKAKVLSSCETKLKIDELEDLDEEYCMRIPRKELHRFSVNKIIAYSLNFFEM